MEQKFKVGDRVKILSTSSYASQAKGTAGVVVALNSSDGDKTWKRVKWDCGYENCYPNVDLRYIRRPTPPKFILTFDGRYRMFDSEKALRADIAELAKEPVANRTFTVYDIKRARKVTLGVKIIIK
jgi:hypothetical protein